MQVEWKTLLLYAMRLEYDSRRNIEGADLKISTKEFGMHKKKIRIFDLENSEYETGSFYDGGLIVGSM
jgi:hypothetical protein